MFHLHLLNHAEDDPGAVCLDGSPGGFYFAPSRGGSEFKNKWVIQLEGGGWCYTHAQCLWRAGDQTFGSSKPWQMNISLPHGPLSADRLENPDFYNFNRVHVKYCDGASFAGDIAQAYTSTSGERRRLLYFRGRRILRASVLRLISTFGLGSLPGTEVILFGCSAGGLAVLFNADFIGTLLPSENIVKYKAVSGSGFFAAHENVFGTPVYESQMRQVFHLQGLSETLPQACIAAHGPKHQWRCALALHVSRFVTTPTFFIDSSVDAWQLGCILTARPIQDSTAEVNYMSRCFSKADAWGTCIRSYKSALVDCTPVQMSEVNRFASDYVKQLGSSRALTKVGNGAFISSCVSHCGYAKDDWNKVMLSNSRKIGGTKRTMRQAVTTWWQDFHENLSVLPNGSHVYLPCQLRLDAPFQCNPSCPDHTSGGGVTSWWQEHKLIAMISILLSACLLLVFWLRGGSIRA